MTTKRGNELRPHIGIYGRRNYGKSSLINKITKQDIAIVSDIAGTTTDIVKKAIEISQIGPVVIIDTAGIDDMGELGKLRVKKTLDSLDMIDFAILLITHNTFDKPEKNIIDEFKKRNIPFIIIHNKSDLEPLSLRLKDKIKRDYGVPIIDFSIKNDNVQDLIELIKNNLPETAFKTTNILSDIISPGDIVLLITPIDAEAPEGRLILPQVQTIRQILDNNAIAIVCKENEAESIIKEKFPNPSLVITDSQVFSKVDKIVPRHILLTSFSILLARQKGNFEYYLKGTPYIDKLNDNDKILILESCTHDVNCDYDIGRVKIPKWLCDYTGKNLEFKVVSGLEKIDNIKDFAMVIQCGGCVVTKKQIELRLRPAIEAGIPVSNYGMTIAYVKGIFNRAIQPFIDLQSS
ncbi:MAG: [FeFe] hydrogenase H-cluster maturation GTPase HydF [Bacteroidales bacterium]|mgnify:FL=1|jgi:[FeFe] hydrogenase H-cluster maturation GTPase HydF|nr:[FeFe] hydrogenase H-cluster maturation GTPase HydF [Bacteroidales bacterium]